MHELDKLDELHELVAPLDDLLGALAGLLGEAAVAPLRSVALSAHPSLCPDAETPPVLRRWPAATSFTAVGALCRAMADRSGAKGQRWTRNAGYRSDNTPPGFLDNYAYLEVVGPSAPLVSTTVRLGFLLLGPSTLYPEHAHPADEVYVSLGPGWWSRDDDGWRELPGSSVIHHPSGCRHAMRTGPSPMAALYLWTGQIDAPAEMVSTPIVVADSCSSGRPVSD